MGNERQRIDLLGRKLQSSDPEERREAAIDLGRMGLEAVGLLLRALGDQDWRVRKTAVEALVAVKGRDVIEGLINTLAASENAGARNSAIEALIQIGPDSVEPLLVELVNQDVDVRKFVVDILGEIKDPRSVPALIERLADKDENIRVAAAEALGKTKDRRAVEPLLECLARCDQGWIDYAAAEALGEIGDERALGPLIAALQRSSLREPVLESLGKIGNVDTLSPLISGLADPLRIVREVSVVALMAIFRKSTQPDRIRIVQQVRNGISETAVDFLEELLDTSGGELQKAAISVIGWTGRGRAIQKLFSLLTEEDLEEPIVQALLHLDGEKVNALLSGLGHESALVRRVAARVLGEVKAHEAEDALLGLLEDENGHVRSSAAEALGRLGSLKAMPTLLRLLEDEYESVQESAIQALAEIGEESVLDELLRDFTARGPSMRRNIALLLGRFSSSRAADALAFALKDEEPDVRKAVVQAISNQTGQKALKPLMLAITDDDPEVRMLAAEALAKIGGPEAKEALVPLLKDDDLWVRAAAARGLGRIAGEDAGRLLVKHLETATEIFLLAVVEVLGRLRIEEARGPLLKLADHPDPEVRKTVLAALAGFGGPAVHRAVISRLSDPHWSVRKAAVELLKGHKDFAAVPLLERLAEEDPDHIVRLSAREALGG